MGQRNGTDWTQREYRAGETVTLGTPNLTFAVDDLYAGVELDAR